VANCIVCNLLTRAHENGAYTLYESNSKLMGIIITRIIMHNPNTCVGLHWPSLDTRLFLRDPTIHKLSYLAIWYTVWIFLI